MADHLKHIYVSELHDLHDYRERFSKMRDFHSLTIRRSSTGSIRQWSSYTLDECGLDTDKLIDMLNCFDSKTIRETNLEEIDDVRILMKFAYSKDLATALVNAVANYQQFDHDALLKILDWIAVLFSASSETTQHIYTDDGLFYTVLDLLDTAISPNLLAMICKCAMTDTYARDMMTCLGIHTRLIEIAIETQDPGMCECCLTCVLLIFRNEGEMESPTVAECVDGLITLFERNQKIVMECFIEMVNQSPSIVATLVEKGVYQIALKHVMEQTDLTKVSIGMLGNLSRSSPSFLSEMVEQGLLDCLLGMVAKQEHLSDVYWALWNILQTVPAMVIPRISSDFVGATISLWDGCGFDVKKECGFFIATLILLLEVRQLGQFICVPVIDALSDIMNCGVSRIEIRCVDALAKMFLAASNGVTTIGDLVAIFEECRVSDCLVELTESDDAVVVERAGCLLRQIERWLERNAQ